MAPKPGRKRKGSSSQDETAEVVGVEESSSAELKVGGGDEAHAVPEPEPDAQPESEAKPEAKKTKLEEPSPVNVSAEHKEEEVRDSVLPTLPTTSEALEHESTAPVAQEHEPTAPVAQEHESTAPAVQQQQQQVQAQAQPLPRGPMPVPVPMLQPPQQQQQQQPAGGQQVAYTAPPSLHVPIVPEGTTKYQLPIPDNKVGSIIGQKGTTIQQLQERSACHLKMSPQVQGQQRFVEMNGTTAQIQNALILIHRVMAEGLQVLHPASINGGPTQTITIDVGQQYVGRLIGHSGNTIKELQSRSGASIKMDQNVPEGAPRKVIITGTQAACQNAFELVNYVVQHGPGLPPLTMGGTLPGAVSHVVDVPKASIGRIIGKGGETISQIQATTGARVQIDQNVPEGAMCRVNLSGMQAQVAAAAQAVMTLIQDGGGPMGGGGPQRGGGWNGGGPDLMPMGYPSQAHGAYGMPAAGPMGYPTQAHAVPMGYPPQGPGGYGAPGGYPPQAHAYAAYGHQQQSMAQQHQQPHQQQPHQQHQQPHPQQPHQQQQQQQQHTHQYQPQMQPAGAAYGAYQQQQSAGARAPAQAAGPHHQSSVGQWIEYKDASGKPYYHNAATNATQWERPTGM